MRANYPVKANYPRRATHATACRLPGLVAFIYLVLSSSLFFTQARAQPAGFAAFIQTLKHTPLAQRKTLVEQYLSTIVATPLREGQTHVHFLWYGKADTVHLEGDLQQAWKTPHILEKIDCGGQDLFFRSYQVPADALLEYRFVMDGKAMIDRRNPAVSPSFDFGDRNVLRMPGFKDSPYTAPRYGIDKGTVSRFLFKTKTEPFTNHLVWVYTPHGYSKTKQYPVLYVYDGQWALYDRPFVNVLDNLIFEGKIEPVVVVFISFEDRWEEYVAKSREYAQLMAQQMVPFIESLFSVSTTAHRRAIMGASAAGHGAMVTALLYPEVFGNVASQGGGAGGTPSLSQGVNAALEVYLSKKQTHPLRKVYSEVGTFDLNFPARKMTFLEGARQFHYQMQKAGLEHLYREASIGHTGQGWDQGLDDILLLFFGPGDTPLQTGK